VLDLAGLGPAPFATMMLADFGANVLSIRRPDPLPFDPAAAMARGKKSIGLDLRNLEGQAVARRLAANSDVLVEGFRPGVTERLGLGPETLMEINPRLIYARLTGWGQTGPYSLRAGHDINYLAISGALGTIGETAPVAPPALLGDLANGSYPLVMGVLFALYEREKTGRGQVVDAAITDGAAYMLTGMFGERALGLWDGDKSHHLLSGAAPFYGVYVCADGRFFSVGAIEQKFYASMLNVLGLTDVEPSVTAQMDFSKWPALKQRIALAFKTRSQAEWTALFAEAEACGAPVLDFDELLVNPHLMERRTVQTSGAAKAAAPAPRLSNHPDLVTDLAQPIDASANDLLADAGFSAAEVDALITQKIVWST